MLNDAGWLNQIQVSLDTWTEDLRQFREHLHQHPEISWQEYQTADFIEQRLIDWDYQPKRIGETGIIADLNPGITPTIAYRADIDALPIPEQTGLNYASERNGFSHACGHDFHTATGLALAKALSTVRKQINGNVRFLFQPAEEVIPSGADAFVKAGAIDNCLMITGMHSEPNLPAGHVSIVDGWLTTQMVKYHIVVSGKGGHSARPNEAVDPILAASSMIQDVYRMMNRSAHPDVFAVMTFTKILGGDAINVIPDHVLLGGTLRITHSDRLEPVMMRIQNTLKQSALLTGVDVSIETETGPPPVVNNGELVRVFRETAANIEGMTVHSDVRTVGGDDFSIYLKQIPGCYVRLGVNSPHYGLHSPKFQIDPDAYPFALRFFLAQFEALFRHYNG